MLSTKLRILKECDLAVEYDRESLLRVHRFVTALLLQDGTQTLEEAVKQAYGFVDWPPVFDDQE